MTHVRYFKSALNDVRYVYGSPIPFTRQVAENIRAGREPLDNGPKRTPSGSSPLPESDSRKDTTR